MRLGILGGTFDPPHVGHLLAAVDAYESLSLNRLIVVPAAAQPLKATVSAMASAGDRLKMVQLAFGGDSRFEVSPVEIERGGLSYTVDTLEKFASERPGTEMFLILGMDSLASLDRWKSPERIRELATLAVLEREQLSESRSKSPAPGVVRIGTRRLDVSSSEIRRRLREGKPIKGFVTESVERYIATAGLYRSESAPA